MKLLFLKKNCIILNKVELSMNWNTPFPMHFSTQIFYCPCLRKVFVPICIFDPAGTETELQQGHIQTCTQKVKQEGTTQNKNWKKKTSLRSDDGEMARLPWAPNAQATAGPQGCWPGHLHCYHTEDSCKCAWGSTLKWCVFTQCTWPDDLAKLFLCFLGW